MKWIINKLIRSILAIYSVVSITFVLLRMIPGNPIDSYAMQIVYTRRVSKSEAYKIAQGIFKLSLDRPLWEQYLEYVNNLLRGDFGVSINLISSKPVLQIIAEAIPWTIFLLSISTITSFTIGVLLGIVAAYKRETIYDRIITMVSTILSVIPSYIAALGFLLIVHFELGIGPRGGTYDAFLEPGFTLEFIGSVLYHAFLPLIAYVMVSFGGWVLAMKSSTLSVLGEDYVMAAEARGLRKRRIMLSYVGRNAMLPLITSLTINIGYMFGGAIFIETVFSYKGIGLILSSALGLLDYPVIQGCFIIITVAVVSANFITDLLYSKLDPRIKWRDLK